jgi:hypothetical protein
MGAGSELRYSYVCSKYIDFQLTLLISSFFRLARQYQLSFGFNADLLTSVY